MRTCSYCWVHVNHYNLCKQVVTTGNEFWASFCTGFESGIDCLTGEEGQLDDLLTEALHVGNVLDYGADPNGELTSSSCCCMHLLSQMQFCCGPSIADDALRPIDVRRSPDTGDEEVSVGIIQHHRIQCCWRTHDLRSCHQQHRLRLGRPQREAAIPRCDIRGVEADRFWASDNLLSVGASYPMLSHNHLHFVDCRWSSV